MADDRGQLHFLKREHHFSGSFIIFPSILPISLNLPDSSPYSFFEIYSQDSAVCSQCCVSACSPSASDNLLIKCATYLLFCQAPAIFAPTEREDRLI